jgi:hypothetical protein
MLDTKILQGESHPSKPVILTRIGVDQYGSFQSKAALVVCGTLFPQNITNTFIKFVGNKKVIWSNCRIVCINSAIGCDFV